MDWILLFVNACAPYDSVNRKCISLHRVDMHEFHPRIGRSVNIMLKFKHLFRTTQLRINIFNVLMYFCMLPKNHWRHKSKFYGNLCMPKHDRESQRASRNLKCLFE